MDRREIEVEVPQTEQLQLLAGLRALWREDRLCDVALESSDGVAIRAHRVVVSAASRPLAALLDGFFAEGSSSAVRLDASADTLRAALQYLYGEPATMRLEHIPEALQFAHLYDLLGFEAAIGRSVLQRLDADLALLLLAECDLLGLVELEDGCERWAAKHFSRCMRSDVFSRLPAAWVGRILRHEELEVPSEEAVLQAVLSWRRAASGRDESAGLLLQHVRFSLLSLPTLRAVELRAQSMGKFGTHLQREARAGVRKHRTTGAPRISPPAKRRCFLHWWPDLGSSSPGGIVVAGGNGRGDGPNQLNEPTTVALQRGAVVVADKRNGRVVRWAAGAKEGQAVVGQGAPLNGINDIGMSLSVATAPNGGLFVVDRNNDRVLQVHDSSAEVLGGGLWELRRPLHVCATREGAVYVLDEDGTRVQRLAAGAVSLVTGGQGRATGHGQLQHGRRLCVRGAGELYISDYGSARVQHWPPGAAQGHTVAGGRGEGDALDQLNGPSGLFVTEDGTLYIADKKNHRIVKWLPGATSGVVVAGGHGQGTGPHQLSDPVDVVLDGDGALYVVELSGDRVTRWGPPGALQLDGLQ